MVHPSEAMLFSVIFLVVVFLKHVPKKLTDPCKVFLYEMRFTFAAFERRIEEFPSLLAHAVQGWGKNKPMSLNTRF
jgi:hypothetical protein